MTKNPKPIQELPDSESDQEESTTFEEIEEIPKTQAVQEENETTPASISPDTPNPSPARKKKRRTAAEWEKKVGIRTSTTE